MNICYIASECHPFVKTGGLADVSGALPVALESLGCNIKIFLPLYNAIHVEKHNIIPLEDFKNIKVSLPQEKFSFNVYHTKLQQTKIDVYFIDCPQYFFRDEIYTNDPDEDKRFIFFQFAVITFLQHIKWSPDIIHCNDWQTALIPAYLKNHFSWDSLFSGTKTLLSIHNIAYQGSFPPQNITNAGFMPDDIKEGSSFELFGSFNFLKTGISFADAVSTVSPAYASETKTPEFGNGLDTVLLDKKDNYIGILNGIDTNIWNPATDKFIPSNYSFNTLGKKKINKIELLNFFNLQYNPDNFLIGIISRLAYQKGFDIIIPALDDLLKLNVQFVVLGKGDESYENSLLAFARKYPFKFSVYIGYNNELSHLITAGSDMFLMPSRYEPCGLNQMYSLNYGTIPIVRKTGGLADTVIDFEENMKNGNGFSFADYTPDNLLAKIKTSLKIIGDNSIRTKIIEKGMKQDFSWNQSALKYLNLYRNIVK
jgi:starch synthase